MNVQFEGTFVCIAGKGGEMDDGGRGVEQFVGVRMVNVA